MHPVFELEEIQAPPLTAEPVMHALSMRSTVRARHAIGYASQIEVDASARGVKLVLFATPGSLQTQCTGKQPFNCDAHLRDLQKGSKTTPWICGQLGVTSSPQAPPSSFTVMNYDSQFPHGMTRGRQTARAYLFSVVLNGRQRHLSDRLKERKRGLCCRMFASTMFRRTNQIASRIKI